MPACSLNGLGDLRASAETASLAPSGARQGAERRAGPSDTCEKCLDSPTLPMVCEVICTWDGPLSTRAIQGEKPWRRILTARKPSHPKKTASPVRSKVARSPVIRRPQVPKTWTDQTSFEQWLPDVQKRLEFEALLKKAVSASAIEKAKIYKAATKLLPSALREGHPTFAWRVASPNVESVAIEILAYAARATRTEDITWAQSELTRILPDLPCLSLGCSLTPSFLEVIDLLDRRSRSGPPELLAALGELYGFATTT